MNLRIVVGVGIAIAIVTVIIMMLQIFIPVGQQDVSTLGLPTPSPTFQLSSTTLRATPTSAHVMDSITKATRQPTPTLSPEILRRGQSLYYALGCFECHGIKAGGEECPPIARTSLSLELVIHQVYHPRHLRMPTYDPAVVSESDIAGIYAYLQRLKLTPRPQITTDHPDVPTGALLYLFFGCFGCHGYQAEGGFGPRLAATKLSLEEVRNQLRNPRARMPTFGPDWVSDEELTHIYAFMQNFAPYDETD